MCTQPTQVEKTCAPQLTQVDNISGTIDTSWRNMWHNRQCKSVLTSDTSRPTRRYIYKCLCMYHVQWTIYSSTNTPTTSMYRGNFNSCFAKTNRYINPIKTHMADKSWNEKHCYKTSEYHTHLLPSRNLHSLNKEMHSIKRHATLIG